MLPSGKTTQRATIFGIIALCLCYLPGILLVLAWMQMNLPGWTRAFVSLSPVYLVFNLVVLFRCRNMPPLVQRLLIIGLAPLLFVSFFAVVFWFVHVPTAS